MKRIRMVLMALALMPLMALAGTLDEGLNCPSLEWTTGGTPSQSGENVNWTYCSDDSYSDGACVVSGAGGAGDATSWIKATVAGPCKISFRYKVQTYNGTFKVMDGSTTLYEYTGVTGTSPSWQYKEFDLADGSHEIKLQYRHPGMGYAYQFNGVKVDEFTVTANATLASALDTADLTFTTGGNADWFPQTSVTHDGEDAVRSGAISGNQSTWLQTTVTGPKQIRFWWKTSSEANYDILRFYVDDTEKASVSGTTDWSQKTVTVSEAGEHTLKWQYSKDGSVNSGDDCGWVDQLVITTDAPSGEAQTYYVNGTTGNDSNTGLSVSTAKKTIQAAIDVAADGSTILVSAGTYEPITTENKQISIIGLRGASETFIDGGNTSRCVTVRRDVINTNTVIQGFTIFHGQISENGGGVYGGTLKRCVIRDNVVNGYHAGGGVDSALLVNCLVVSNRAVNGGGIGGCVAINCTLVDNKATHSGDGAYDSSLVNCLMSGGGNYQAYDWNNNPLCAAWGLVTKNNFNGEPIFRNATTGDYRLSADSPCIDAGDDLYVTELIDLDGNCRIANGTVDIGCYEYGSEPLITEGLVAWYKFDGDANDSSGNGNHGVVHGATLTTDRFGNENSAYHFGDGKYIIVPNSESLNTPVDEITVATWVNVDDLVYPSQYGTVTIIGKGNWEELQYGMHYMRSYDKQISIGRTPTGSLLACTNLTLDVHDWIHIAYTFKQGVALTYLNGNLISVYTNAISSFYSGNADLRIARNTCGLQECMHGSLDDLRIYNRALSAAEVSAIYNEGESDPTVYRTVTFNANGGTYTTTATNIKNGEAIGALPTATRAGYDFVGWFTAADGCTQVSASTVVTADVTWYAHWQAIEYTISYSGLRGASNSNPTNCTIEDEMVLSNPGDVTGYRFICWSPSSVSELSSNITVTANWTPIAYTISYANTMGAANSNPTSYTIEDSVSFAALPDVDGWRFLGWSFAGVSRGTTGDLTVSANWEKKIPDFGPNGDDDEPMDASIANTYDGVIVDADGLPMGYINVKTAKATGKGDTKVSKVTATIQMAGEAKKITIKASVQVSEATMTQAAADGRVLDLAFSRDGFWGTFDGYEIEGVRNLLISTAKSDKGTDAKVAADVVYAALVGNYVMAYQDDIGWNGLSITVMTKGKVRVSGKLANGTSVATTSQLIVGSDYSVIPVIYTKNDTSLAFNVYFSNDGAEAEVFGYYDAVISSVGGLGSGLSFYLGDSVYDLFGENYSLCDQFLPYGLSVEPVSASKWSVANGAKAGSIKLKDGEVIDTKESDNPSGLKLTFNSRAGTFSGSFKVYALDSKDKLKTFTATVSGVVIDGIGYGTATIKKIGSCAVVIAE